MKYVDLNSDLGEGTGLCISETDKLLIPLISSANIACSFHAGNPDIMADSVRACHEAGTALGAHPGFPDRENFGRTKMELSAGEIRNLMIYQIGAMSAFAADGKVRLQHVKPHGALYNMASADIEIARAIAQAVSACNKAAGADETEGLILLGQGGSKMEAAAHEYGVRFACEVFADRAYNDDGTLVARSLPGAVIHDTDEAVRRTVRMVTEGKVTSVTGKDIDVKADSICVHGDTPEALSFVRAIRKALEDAGVAIRLLR